MFLVHKTQLLVSNFLGSCQKGGSIYCGFSTYVAEQQDAGDSRTSQEIAEEYNDKIIYPDKVRLNCYYYRHYSFLKDIQMILCTVLGKKMEYAGELI